MITYTVQVDEIGNQFWYYGKELSRNDGPAAIFASGDRKWYQNGLLHREDGPAIEYANGNRAWCQNGLLHREDGPAIELSAEPNDGLLEVKNLVKIHLIQ